MTKTDFNAKYDHIVENVDKIMSLSKWEKENLTKIPVGKILVGIAYIGGCTDPEAVATLRVSDHIAFLRMPSIFLHKKGQSIRERLSPAECFPGADPKTIEYGMLLLETMSINDHSYDLFEDVLTNHPNPFSSTELSLSNEVQRVKKALQCIPNSIKTIFITAMGGVEIVASFWQLSIANASHGR